MGLRRGRGNFANYNDWLYVFPGIGACGWAGRAWVGGPGAWINGGGSMSTYVAGHEMGHNFGLYHAHSLSCGGVSIGPTCTRSEYGDTHDIMGSGTRHFSAYAKDSLGWLPAGSVRVHGGGTATYTIGAIEAPGQSAYAVRIPTTMSARTYWIEWRDRTGFDAGEPANIANGALVRLGPSAVGGSDLLDMAPATSTVNDAELDTTKSFTDSALSLTITTLSKTASSLTVQVDYGAPPPASLFHALTPCRVLDTRNPNGTYGGPALYASQARSFVIRGRCGVPATAKSIAGNLTVTGATAVGSIRLVPGGAPVTGTSTVNFRAGQTRANNVTMALGASGNVAVDSLPSGTAHVILDVVGWFE